MRPQVNYKTGQLIGSLVFLKRVNEGNGLSQAKFSCRCGIEFDCAIALAKNGVQKYCSIRCKQREMDRKKEGKDHTRFKGGKSPEYSAWTDMKRRCYNSKSSNYHNYGGRGISVCDRWFNSFSNFFKDMGARPSKDHSLDRFPNNDGNYEQTNCRWATEIQQQQNKRMCINITHNESTKCVTQWARENGMDATTLMSRIKSGKSIHDALTTKIKRRDFIEYKGDKRSISQWAKFYGMKYITLYNRLKKGVTIDNALLTPIRKIAQKCQ